MLRAIFLPIVILITAEIFTQILMKIPEPTILESVPLWAWGLFLLPYLFAYGLAGWNVLQRKLGGLGYAALTGITLLLIETFIRISADLLLQPFDLDNSFVGYLRPLVDLTPHLSVKQMAVLGVVAGQFFISQIGRAHV